MTAIFWCTISYFMLLMQTVIHEFSHFIVAKKLHLPVKTISIGYKKCAIKIKNLYFSPIFAGGHVEVSEKDLLILSSLKIISFFEAGTIANLIFSLFPLIFFRNTYTFIWSVLGGVLVLSANLPLESTDVYNAFITIRKKNQNNHESVEF